MSSSRTGRVVATAIGAVTGFGAGVEPLWRAVRRGEEAIRPLTVCRPPRGRGLLAGEIADFDPSARLGQKGLRNMSRASQLLMTAIAGALGERGAKPSPTVDPALGIVVGTASGTLSSIAAFDRETLLEGPQYVSPLAFTNTVWNSPAGESAIRFGFGGPNATVATGFTAGHDAVGYAAELIRSGRADTVIAAGVEQLSEEWLLSAFHGGFLAMETGKGGAVLGEGACALVLEREEAARSGGRRILGEVAGYGNGFDPKGGGDGHRGTDGWVRAVEDACRHAGVRTADIGLVSLNRAGIASLDAREEEVLARLSLDDPGACERHSVKFSFGELAGASGVVQSCVALLSLAEGLSPPLRTGYGAAPLRAPAPSRICARHALVMGADARGRSAALVFGRVD